MELKTTVGDTQVTANFAVTKKEIEKYLEYMATKHNRHVSDIEAIALKLLDDNKVDIDAKFTETKFERIRRITGYLVGTTDRWNDAKKAELRDRVKHA